MAWYKEFYSKSDGNDEPTQNKQQPPSINEQLPLAQNLQPAQQKEVERIIEVDSKKPATPNVQPVNQPMASVSIQTAKMPIGGKAKEIILNKYKEIGKNKKVLNTEETVDFLKTIFSNKEVIKSIPDIFNSFKVVKDEKESGGLKLHAYKKIFMELLDRLK
ncbi:MAG: hypothetical protein AABY32_02655 [Nanoarchaeota archaeon]